MTLAERGGINQEQGCNSFEERAKAIESILKIQKGNKSWIGKKMNPALIDALTVITYAVDDSIQRQGGKARATNIQVFEDIGKTEERDPNTPYYYAVEVLTELKIALRSHTPTILNNFVETYFALCQNGASSVNELNAVRKAPSKSNDCAGGRISHTRTPWLGKPDTQDVYTEQS